METLQIRNLLPVETQSSIGKRINDLSNTTFIGVDFGTSNTVVSIASLSNDEIFLETKSIHLRQKLVDDTITSSYLVPSMVAWYKQKLLFGQGAYDVKHKLGYGKNLWHSFKMELGEDVGCKYPNSELGKNHPVITILNPKDVTQLFFRFLNKQIKKYVADNNLPQRLKYSISVPASFEANQRRDLIDCMKAAGIDVTNQSLIDEPNAAFLGFVLHTNKEKRSINIPENYYPNVLVFDFGAGTCDISILEIGSDYKGLNSKNIAISRFEELGGDNIDQLITIDVLLEQLFAGSALKEEDFRTRELRELIISRLLKVAERLKISVSEEINLKNEQKYLSKIAERDEKVELGISIEIETSKGVLRLENPYITYEQFANINTVFTNEKTTYDTNRIENQVKFPSVLKPIKSALKKANFNRNDIDYVLFIGGSSKNPFIREAVTSYFSGSDALIPDDMQAHVSSGASIHSLILNGFDKNIIKPITSEPLMIITKDGNRETLHPIVEAGTTMPSEKIVFDNLSPQREGQEIIEIPICVSNKNKILYNIQFHASDGGFIKNTPISLEVKINIDKVVLVKAYAGNQEINVIPLNPFANQELTSDDRIEKKAEKQFNLECARNGGEPTKKALKDLYNIYNDLGKDFKAAETLELLNELFPEEKAKNNIGLHYSNAGKTEKAIEHYKAEFSETKSSTTAFNLALALKRAGKKDWKEYLETAYEAEPDDELYKYNYAKSIQREDPEKAKKLKKESFDSWKKRFNNDNMNPWDYSWFASCARDLGEITFASIIENAKPSREEERLFKNENLSQLKQENNIINK